MEKPSVLDIFENKFKECPSVCEVLWYLRFHEIKNNVIIRIVEKDGFYSIVVKAYNKNDIKNQKNLKRKFYYQIKQKQKEFFKTRVLEELMMKIFHPKNI